MDKIPAIGGARGVFEIFVPGVFLVANLIGAVYLSPWTEVPTAVAIPPFDNSVIGLVLLVCFGYLLGVLFRLARADTPDRWSQWYLRRFNHWAFADDPFPYFAWLEQSCKDYLPSRALEYFNDAWKPQARSEGNKPFFNLCKMATVNSGSSFAVEAYAAEALTRYIACMFYALRIALVVALFSAAVQLFHAPKVAIVWGLLCVLYAIALFVIVKNYRRVRFKEVDTVFAACFISSEPLKADGKSKPSGT